MEPLREALINCVRDQEPGAVFTPGDFSSLGNRQAIDRVLARLVRDGELRHIGRGIYARPRFSERFGFEVSPSPDAVVRAVARKTGITLGVTGAQAANMLGLSDQVPARPVYMTNGANRRVRIGNQTIELRKTRAKSAQAHGRPSAPVIEALRYLGKRHIDDTVVRKLRENLNELQRASLRDDRFLAPGWMQSIIERIVETIAE